MSEDEVGAREPAHRPGAARAVLAGCSASFAGIGLARFGFTPLLPAGVAAGWFPASGAGYLGAINLVGYLAGALLARPLARRLPLAWLLRAMMALTAASFIASARPLSFAWFFPWRLAAGLSGGIIMVLAPGAVLALVPARRRGLVSGAIFAGIGLGIALSGTLVPLLLRQGLGLCWLGLGGLALVATLIAWGGWPAAEPAPAAGEEPPFRASPALWRLWLGYGLNAVGLVPHMVFLADFIARGLGQGIAAGSVAWILFGLGALAGPAAAGALADRIGFRLALRLALAVQAAAIALVLAGAAGRLVSILVIGGFVPGIVPIVLGRVHDLVDEPDRRRQAWSRATVAFAVGQAAAGYGFSALFAWTADYRLMFLAAAAAPALALAIELVPGLRTRSRRP